MKKIEEEEKVEDSKSHGSTLVTYISDVDMVMGASACGCPY